MKIESFLRVFFLALVVRAEVQEVEVTADGTAVVVEEETAPSTSTEESIEETPEQVVETPEPVKEEETVAEDKPEPVVEDKPVIDPKCPDRDHIVKCAGAYLDTNKNNKLDRDELQAAIDSLPWYAKGILKILGSVDKMMKKCDVDGDDAISMDYDMQNNKEECLATCFKRRAFKGSFFPDCNL